MIKIERPRNHYAWLARDRWSGAQGEVRAEILEMINSLPQVLRPLSASEVLVRGMYLMNDQPMHEGSGFVRRFDAEAIRQTAELVRGAPVLRNHTTDGDDGLPIGRFFHAEHEERGDGSNWLASLFYMLNDEPYRRIANAIDGGIISENSPTIQFDRAYCSICGASEMRCDHAAGKLYDGKKCYMVMTDITDFWEGSIVWAGQQKGTGYYIAAGRDSDSVVTAEDYFRQIQAEQERPAPAWDEYMQT